MDWKFKFRNSTRKLKEKRKTKKFVQSLLPKTHDLFLESCKGHIPENFFDISENKNKLVIQHTRKLDKWVVVVYH